MEFLQKILVWLDAYIWPNIKVLGGCIGVLFSAMAVYLPRFGDFLLGLVEHGAWPLLIGFFGWRYGAQVVTSITNFIDRHQLDKAKTRMGDFELSRRVASIDLEVQKTASAIQQTQLERLVEAPEEQTDYREFFERLTRRFGDEIGNAEFDDRFWDYFLDQTLTATRGIISFIGIDENIVGHDELFDDERFDQAYDTLSEDQQLLTLKLMQRVLTIIPILRQSVSSARSDGNADHLFLAMRVTMKFMGHFVFTLSYAVDELDQMKKES